jgi:hypothetical protein
MSSPFSFDNWDLLLDPSPGLTSSLSETPSSATSGEFHPFVNIGLHLSGGDRKTFTLLHGGDTDRLCCGFIGSQSNAKFCIRAAPCGIAAHARKFEVAPSSFYLKENETRAFVNPSFKGEGLSDQEIRTLLAAKHTLKELAAFFTERRSKLVVATEPLFEGAASEPQTPSVLQSLTVLSPAMKEDTAGLKPVLFSTLRVFYQRTRVFSPPHPSSLLM